MSDTTTLENALRALLDASDNVHGWAREVSDEYLEGDPETRAAYVSDMKAYREAASTARATLSPATT